MALGSTQPVTEMSTKNLPGGEGRPALKADNLTAVCESIMKMWEPRRLTTPLVSTASYLTFTNYITIRLTSNILSYGFAILWH
jgi:hypothetical protein